MWQEIGGSRSTGAPTHIDLNPVGVAGSAVSGVLIEEWGGDVISVPISALNGDGVDELVENVIVLSEVSELKANPERYALGVVVDARRDKSRGSVATLLIQTGTLEIGDNIVIGGMRGKVRAMIGRTIAVRAAGTAGGSEAEERANGLEPSTFSLGS